MEPQLKVKTEFLPERCDICHQADLFDPQTNICMRCKDTKISIPQNDRAIFSSLKNYIPPSLPLASTGKRFINMLLDAIILRIFIVALIVPLVFISPMLVRLISGSIFSMALELIFFFLYYFGFELYFQRTPAKFITGTKVVNLDGSKPDANALLKRTFVRLIPFEAFSRSEGTWWHDRLADTRVINIKDNLSIKSW